jgi:hypothetical protein
MRGIQLSPEENPTLVQSNRCATRAIMPPPHGSITPLAVVCLIYWQVREI